MLEYLPEEVRAGLAAARKADLRKKSRLRVHVGDKIYPVLRYWETGFALDAEHGHHFRGLVDIYDGARHLYQCLVVACDEDNGELVFEFKRSTVAADKAPLDYVRDENAPIALLGR
jgi:hypothetical protein